MVADKEFENRRSRKMPMASFFCCVDLELAGTGILVELTIFCDEGSVRLEGVGGWELRRFFSFLR